MSHDEKEIHERLGSEGLSLVLDHVLDHRRLVRLANACGLEYPGMRVQAQKRDTLLQDLVERAATDEGARTAVLRAVQKETRAAVRRWKALTPEQKAERLSDPRFLAANGNMGLHLYILAAAESEGEGDAEGFETLLARQQLLRMAAEQAKAKAARGKPSRQEVRLQKRIAELQKKLQHVEGQLVKSRDGEKAIKKDLIQRKGELAESRMLVERLRRDLDSAESKVRQQDSVAQTAKETAAEKDAIAPVARAVRKLASEQRKLAHRVEKMLEVRPAPPKALPVDEGSLAPLVEGLDQLRKEIGSRRRDGRKELAEQVKHLEQVAAGLAEQAGRGLAARRRPRAKGEPERVGLFIDVQNMYYGAKQLKGKLDFDALQRAAVRDRRLIQATAYVVESKEIDQSDFIALLEQMGIEVRRKTLQVRADGSMKGDWDMELALDILDAADALDVVVLVSGDGDFTSLVKRVKRMGPRVEVFGFPRNTAKSLLEAADEFQPLDRNFMIYARRSRKGSRDAAPGTDGPADDAKNDRRRSKARAS